MIEVKNVKKMYGNFIAVDNISFTVADGEIMGFLGPNGAGKTTTMNMLTGFIEPTDGVIRINGYDIIKDSNKAKKEIGYMPEGVPSYSNMTVKEFVDFMAELKKVRKKEKKENVDKVIKEVGLESVSNKLIRNISRGYRQRVSLAGALVGNPKVIILDEPTVGLDPKQIIEIRELIKRLGKNHTILLSSHILSEVSQICNKIVIINKGKIIAIDTPENLEKITSNQKAILLTVEDQKENMKDIKKFIPEIDECKIVKNNFDGTIQYIIKYSRGIELRNKLFKILPQKNIVIFELKNCEKSLEDAFISLIDKNFEYKIENKEEKK